MENRRRPKLRNRILVGIVFLLAGRLVHAADSSSLGAIGVLVGPIFPNQRSMALGYGAEVEYKVSPLYSVGVVYFRYGAGVSVTSSGTSDTAIANNNAAGDTATATSSTAYLGALADLHFGGSFTGLRLGGEIGSVSSSSLVSETTQATGNTTANVANNASGLFLAPRIGYDYLMGHVSIGEEGALYLGLGTGTPTAFGLLTSIKYWF